MCFQISKYDNGAKVVMFKPVSNKDIVPHYQTMRGKYVDFYHDYKTMQPEFMETIWWVFSQLWKQGRVYKSHRIMPYSWKFWVFFRMRKRHLLPALHDGMQGDEDGMQTCERPPLWAFGWPRGGVHMFTSLHVACLARVA